MNVSLSIQTTGTASFTDANQPSTLGVQVLYGYPPGYSGCFGVYQITGTITPSNYTNPVFLRRVATFKEYQDPGATLEGSGSGVNDTSDPSNEKQSGSNVYDEDSPGVLVPSTFSAGDTGRFRVNFDEYAVLGSSDSTIEASQDFLFFVRVSCQKTGIPSLVLDNTYSGDNQIGLGTTKLSDNLQ